MIETRIEQLTASIEKLALSLIARAEANPAPATIDPPKALLAAAIEAVRLLYDGATQTEVADMLTVAIEAAGGTVPEPTPEPAPEKPKRTRAPKEKPAEPVAETKPEPKPEPTPAAHCKPPEYVPPTISQSEMYARTMQQVSRIGKQRAKDIIAKAGFESLASVPADHRQRVLDALEGAE
jgi:outer membrane biosynthesis protein TonB